MLQHMPLTVKGLRPVEEAIVTAGGISLKEFNPKTMESKLVKAYMVLVKYWILMPLQVDIIYRLPFPQDM